MHYPFAIRMAFGYEPFSQAAKKAAAKRKAEDAVFLLALGGEL